MTNEGHTALNLEKLVLDVYIRQGCHLCDDMIHVLSQYRNDYNFEIRTIDIDNDTDLQSRYNALVPVLCRGETEICHHFFDLTALQRAIPVTGNPA